MRDKAFYNNEERKHASHLAKRRPVSGAFPMLRGDIRHGNLLIDTKNYTGKQFTVKVAEMDKIRNEAYTDGAIIGALLVATEGRRFYVFDSDDLERLANAEEDE